MKKFLCFLLIGWAFQSGMAQNAENSLLEDLTEILLENSEEEPDIEELTERWQFYLENPVNINSDCEGKLRQLGFLSEFQIQKIIEYKNKNVPVLSIYELARLDGFSRELLENLQPFLLFGKPENAPAATSGKRSKKELLIRTQRVIEKSRAYSENAYPGSPEKYYMRFKQTGNRLNIGFTAEKDPGETFFRSPNKAGFDYYSGFADFDVKKGKYHFYLGDFLVRAGQGLTLWQGFASGKSAEVSQVYRGNQGIRSYSSSDENRFFRGVAGEMNLKNASLIVFHSEKKIDANLDELNGEPVFTSFQTSGLHRTENEIADKHSVKENASGVLFSFRKNKFSAGISGVHIFFDKPKVSDGQLYKLFLFEGKQITNAGFNYKWSLNRLFLFGEVASSFNGGLANLHGAMLKPADRLELSLVYRNFGKKYNNIYGQTFSESSSINDENGLYIGMKFLPASKISVSAYRDFFQYNWLKYQTYSPSVGSETLVLISYSPSRLISMYLRYFNEQKEIKSTDGQINCNTNRSLQKIRLNLDVGINEQWSMKSRAEFSIFNEAEEEHGLLLLQDLKYKAIGLPFSCQLRLAWFDTESYNCRLYAYENDVLYNFSVPALSGKGIRTYLNCKYSISKKIDLWFKAARTQYFDQNSVGSGWDEIVGDRKTELKIQAMYRF